MKVILTGDVMTGRGIDQILPHAGDPRLYEPLARSAGDYVSLAEQANGPIPTPVGFDYVWGDARAEMERWRPDIRLINLETAVTASTEPAHKGINYKMAPANFPVITAAGVNCCALANNHVLDWGSQGLLDTLDALERAGVRHAGAGRNLAEAAAPAILTAPGGRRALVFAVGSGTSGIPRGWAASDDEAGVHFLSDYSQSGVSRLGKLVSAVRRPGDLVIVSIHWGANWGYGVANREAAFAHGLIDEAAVDVVHGHSSHHAKAIEIYRGKPILYGCGDFLNDYEGISGHVNFRPDLALMYRLAFRESAETPAVVVAVPFRIRKFRLHRASPADAAWLRDTFNREGRRFVTRAELGADGMLNFGSDSAAAWKSGGS